MFNFQSKQTANFCVKFKPTLPHKTSTLTVLITTQTKKTNKCNLFKIWQINC